MFSEAKVRIKSNTEVFKSGRRRKDCACDICRGRGDTF